MPGAMVVGITMTLRNRGTGTGTMLSIALATLVAIGFTPTPPSPEWLTMSMGSRRGSLCHTRDARGVGALDTELTEKERDLLDAWAACGPTTYLSDVPVLPNGQSLVAARAMISRIGRKFEAREWLPAGNGRIPARAVLRVYQEHLITDDSGRAATRDKDVPAAAPSSVARTGLNAKGDAHPARNEPSAAQSPAFLDACTHLRLLGGSWRAIEVMHQHLPGTDDTDRWSTFVRRTDPEHAVRTLMLLLWATLDVTPRAQVWGRTNKLLARVEDLVTRQHDPHLVALLHLGQAGVARISGHRSTCVEAARLVIEARRDRDDAEMEAIAHRARRELLLVGVNDDNGEALTREDLDRARTRIIRRAEQSKVAALPSDLTSGLIWRMEAVGRRLYMAGDPRRGRELGHLALQLLSKMEAVDKPVSEKQRLALLTLAGRPIRVRAGRLHYQRLKENALGG